MYCNVLQTVVGLVLTKQAIRSFPDKKSKVNCSICSVLILLCPDPGSDRYKFSFTLRDSQSDYVNATCWGNEQQITKIFQTFRINDISKDSYICEMGNTKYAASWFYRKSCMT